MSSWAASFSTTSSWTIPPRRRSSTGGSLGRRPGGGGHRRGGDRRAGVGARAERRRRGVRAQRVREGLARGRDRVRRPRAGGRRVLRDEGRRGLRSRERHAVARAGAVVRRGLVGRGAGPVAGDHAGDVRPDARGPAAAVLQRGRLEPARGLQGRAPAAAREASTRQESALEGMRGEMVALKLELARCARSARRRWRWTPRRRAAPPRAAPTRRPWPRRSRPSP